MRTRLNCISSRPKSSVAYLLIYGVLPTKEQYDVFQREVQRHSVMHTDAEEFFRSFR